MASELHIVVTGSQPDQSEDAHRFLMRLESLWSRFIAGSDISRINAGAGSPVEVATETLTLIATMIEAWEITGGRYDPGILPALVANGYSTSLVDPERSTTLADEARCIPGSILDTIIDASTSSVTIPVGLALDPGGIGKGLAADLTVARMLAHGAGGALVSLGGDLSMAGEAPHSDGWMVGIEYPDPANGLLCTLAVSGGGVATSSTVSRRWELDDIPRHHLIDPTTARQSDTDLATVTVIAGTGWAAEAHATAALLTGSTGVLDYLQARGLTGIAVTADGVSLHSDGFETVPT